MAWLAIYSQQCLHYHLLFSLNALFGNDDHFDGYHFLSNFRAVKQNSCTLLCRKGLSAASLFVNCNETPLSTKWLIYHDARTSFLRELASLAIVRPTLVFPICDVCSLKMSKYAVYMSKYAVLWNRVLLKKILRACPGEDARARMQPSRSFHKPRFYHSAKYCTSYIKNCAWFML